MAGNTAPGNSWPPTEQTEPEPTVQQTPQEQASLPGQEKLGQPGSATERAAPGRMPLFRR